MKDYTFSHDFKDACKEEVRDHCPKAMKKWASFHFQLFRRHRLISITPSSLDKHETLVIRANMGRTAASQQHQARQPPVCDTSILDFLI